MNPKNNTRRLVMAALCTALGVVLPLTVHAIPHGGQILLPMHLPVLLCGLTCGGPAGLLCGLLTPLLSHFLTGMPPGPVLPGMLCELAAYGLLSGVLDRLVHTGHRTADLSLRLIAAMLLGRVVYGTLNALVFSPGQYSFSAFVAGAFVTALPGILIQLAVLPPLVLLLERARILPAPYLK